MRSRPTRPTGFRQTRPKTVATAYAFPGRSPKARRQGRIPINDSAGCGLCPTTGGRNSREARCGAPSLRLDFEEMNKQLFYGSTGAFIKLFEGQTELRRAYIYPHTPPPRSPRPPASAVRRDRKLKYSRKSARDKVPAQKYSQAVTRSAEPEKKRAQNLRAAAAC